MALPRNCCLCAAYGVLWMPKAKLTKGVVDRLESRDKDYIEWCGKLTGFGCRVWPSGKKVFIAQYRAKGQSGPPKRVTVGTYGKHTVEQARESATAILAKAELGEDVAGDRAKQKAVMSMADLCDEYLEKGLGAKKPSTVANDKGRIEGHVKPLLGRKRINDITKGDVANFLRDVANRKTARETTNDKGNRVVITGGKGTATRVLRMLGGIFSYAVDQGYIETNPRFGVKGYEENRHERWLTNEELQRLGDTLREAETIGLPWQFNDGVKVKHRPVKPENQHEVISLYAVAAIRLLLLTGCRLREILHLRWQDVDMERGFLNLPTSKTGRKTVVLGAPALKVLADLPRVKGNPYVIVGESAEKPRSDLKRPWKRITDHAGLADLRLHDLLHSFASAGAASGMGLLMVGKLLGHSSPSTTQRYAHIADDPLRRASENVSKQIAAALAGENPMADVLDLGAQQ